MLQQLASVSTTDVRDRVGIIAMLSQVCHQALDHPCVFRDENAERIAGLHPDILAQLAGDDPIYQRSRLYIASRNRFIEESIDRAISAGYAQIVVFGAGLSTFGYRICPPDMAYFEIDRSEAQAWKRHRLADAGVTVPKSLRFVPAVGAATAARLAARGFDHARATVFLWLDSIALASVRDVHTTLRYASRCPTAELLFDYTEPLTTMQSQAANALGLPPLTAFTTEAVEKGLRASGFEPVCDLTSHELTSAYTDRPNRNPILFDLHLVRATRHIARSGC
jgi:methyltransferase (TIGR00027 family)